MTTSILETSMLILKRGKTRNDIIKRTNVLEKEKVMWKLIFNKIGENGATLKRTLISAQVENNFVQVKYTTRIKRG